MPADAAENCDSIVQGAVQIIKDSSCLQELTV